VRIPMEALPPGRRTEVAQYEVRGAARRICAYPRQRRVLLTDEPLDGRGIALLVEPRIETKGIAPLVDDYVRESVRLGGPAMLAPRLRQDG
jgi:hypothetical protein